jgi:hypothetical protein
MKRGGDARLSTVGSKLGATDAHSPPTAPLAAPSAAPLRNGERCLQLEQAAGSGPVQQNGHDAVPNAAEAGAQAGARVHRRERFAVHEPGPYVDDGRSCAVAGLGLDREVDEAHAPGDEMPAAVLANGRRHSSNIARAAG